MGQCGFSSSWLQISLEAWIRNHFYNVLKIKTKKWHCRAFCKSKCTVSPSLFLNTFLKKQEVIPLKHKVVKTIHILSQNTARILHMIVHHTNKLRSQIMLTPAVRHISQENSTGDATPGEASRGHGVQTTAGILPADICHHKFKTANATVKGHLSFLIYLGLKLITFSEYSHDI